VDEVCFRSFRADWLTSGKSPKTIDQYIWALRRIARFGLALPPDLDLVDAREWLAKRQTEVAASTAHFEARTLRVFSAFTTSEFGIEDKLTKLRLPHVPNPGAQLTTSADDVHRLLESFVDDMTFEGVRDRALIHVMWASGARREEVAQMLVTKVYLIEASIELVHVKRTRSGATGRTAPLAGAVRPLHAYLRRRSAHPRQELPQLWISRLGRLTAWGVSQALQRRSKVAEIKLSPQSFRRGVATDWKAQGGSDSGLIAALGWTSPRMLMRYTAANSERLAVEEAKRLRGGP